MSNMSVDSADASLNLTGSLCHEPDNLPSRVVYHRSLLEMIRAGWLCDLRCVQIRTEISLDSVKTTLGDFAQGELASVLNTENRNDLIVEAYQEHAPGR